MPRAFTYDVRCFGGIFDLPTLIRYYTTYIYEVKSDVSWPTYLPKNLTSYVNAPIVQGLLILGLWKRIRPILILWLVIESLTTLIVVGGLIGAAFIIEMIPGILNWLKPSAFAIEYTPELHCHLHFLIISGNALEIWICGCRCILESSGSQKSGCP